MGVYLVGSIHESKYFGTKREALRCKPGGEEPESVTCLDPATECNKLMADVEAAERTIVVLRMLLEDLFEVCPAGSSAYARAEKFIALNPLPPADAANRDGGRSYGTG